MYDNVVLLSLKHNYELKQTNTTTTTTKKQESCELEIRLSVSGSPCGPFLGKPRTASQTRTFLYNVFSCLFSSTRGIICSFLLTVVLLFTRRALFFSFPFSAPLQKVILVAKFYCYS